MLTIVNSEDACVDVAFIWGFYHNPNGNTNTNTSNSNSKSNSNSARVYAACLDRRVLY